MNLEKRFTMSIAVVTSIVTMQLTGCSLFNGNPMDKYSSIFEELGYKHIDEKKSERFLDEMSKNGAYMTITNLSRNTPHIDYDLANEDVEEMFLAEYNPNDESAVLVSIMRFEDKDDAEDQYDFLVDELSDELKHSVGDDIEEDGQYCSVFYGWQDDRLNYIDMKLDGNNIYVNFWYSNNLKNYEDDMAHLEDVYDVLGLELHDELFDITKSDEYLDLSSDLVDKYIDYCESHGYDELYSDSPVVYANERVYIRYDDPDDFWVSDHIYLEDFDFCYGVSSGSNDYDNSIYTSWKVLKFDSVHDAEDFYDEYCWCYEHYIASDVTYRLQNYDKEYGEGTLVRCDIHDSATGFDMVTYMCAELNHNYVIICCVDDCAPADNSYVRDFDDAVNYMGLQSPRGI